MPRAAPGFARFYVESPPHCLSQVDLKKSSHTFNPSSATSPFGRINMVAEKDPNIRGLGHFPRGGHIDSQCRLPEEALTFPVFLLRACQSYVAQRAEEDAAVTEPSMVDQTATG